MLWGPVHRPVDRSQKSTSKETTLSPGGALSVVKGLEEWLREEVISSLLN